MQEAICAESVCPQIPIDTIGLFLHLHLLESLFAKFLNIF